MVNVSIQASAVTVSGTSVLVGSTSSPTNVTSTDSVVSVTPASGLVSVTPAQQTISVTATPVINNVITGIKSLADLVDVDLTGKIDQSLLVYDQPTGVFTTAPGHTVPSIADGGNF